jgi:glucokinase
VKVGVDLGGTNIQAVALEDGARVLGSARRATPKEGGAPAVATEIAATVRDCLEAVSVDVGALSGVGIGAPGSIDGAAGVVVKVSNIAGWDEAYALAPAVERELGVPTALGNDVSAAVEAERRFGAGRGLRSFLGVFWGTGIGGGLVVDGRLLHGRGSSGELGHVCVRPGGRRCNCGLRGCVEAYAGRGPLEARARRLARKRKTSLFDLMQARGRDRLTSGLWSQALDEGDELAVSLIDEAVSALGIAVGSAVTLLDVEAVIVGGGLGLRLGEPYVERIEQAAREHTFFGEPPVYRLAELGDLGGAIGASLLVP